MTIAIQLSIFIKNCANDARKLRTGVVNTWAWFKRYQRISWHFRVCFYLGM